MYVYQLGNTVIKGFLEFSSPIAWRGKPVQSQYSSKVRFDIPYDIPEPVSMTLSGVLYCDGQTTIDQYLQSLTALGGKPYVDVIGYLPNYCCQIGKRCTCNGTFSTKGASWWTTYGIVTNISRVFAFDDSTGLMPETRFEVELELTVNPLWMPINLMNWFPYYGTDQLSPFTFYDLTLSTSELLPEMQIPKWVAPFNFFPEFIWVKKSYSDSSIFSQLYTNFTSYYEFLFPSSYFVTSNEDVNSSNPISNLVVENPFNGLIYSLYFFAFQNVSATTATLTTSILSEIAPGNIQNNETIIDFGDIGDAMASVDYGSATLGSNDLCFIETEELPNSFVIRSSAPSVKVANSSSGIIMPLPCTYNTRQPLEMVGLRNRFSMTSDNANSIQVRQLHVFRRL